MFNLIWVIQTHPRGFSVYQTEQAENIGSTEIDPIKSTENIEKVESAPIKSTRTFDNTESHEVTKTDIKTENTEKVELPN